MKLYYKYFLSILVLLLISNEIFANNDAYYSWSQNDIIRSILTGVSILLLLIIFVLGKSIKSSIHLKRQRILNERKSNKSMLTIIALVTMSLFANNVLAQETVETVAEPSKWFMVPADIIVMVLVIILELIIVLLLVRVQFNIIVDVPAKSDKKAFNWQQFFQKVNNTVPLENEDALDLHHDYDGIRELDNKIPSWWLGAFGVTVVIAVIYMYRMFVTETLPDQITELDESNRIAAILKAEYLANAANNVDENTVTMLDASGIAAGMHLFNAKGCATCHGDKGQGNDVGPNLTDDYWLHKGSINDIFYSIKYGWPDKGMISWESQLSPIQIAQIASYIKSLKNSNPANAKAPQGDLYEEVASTEVAAEVPEEN